MNDVQTATKRTTVNAAITGVIVTSIVRVLDIELDENSVMVLGIVIGAATGVVYRTSRAITAKWPKLGYVLFGSGKEPTEYVRQT
jgi:hypothetical protein